MLPCSHSKTHFPHCSVMLCPNYVSSCPVHAVAQTGTRCSLETEEP